jgi:hypothetical protein
LRDKEKHREAKESMNEGEAEITRLFKSSVVGSQQQLDLL